MSIVIKDIENSSLTELTTEEAASVSGGNLGGYDFQGQFYAPGTASLFDPNTYLPILQQQENLLAGQLAGAYASGGNTGILNSLLSSAQALTGL